MALQEALRCAKHQPTLRSTGLRPALAEGPAEGYFNRFPGFSVREGERVLLGLGRVCHDSTYAKDSYADQCMSD